MVMQTKDLQKRGASFIGVMTAIGSILIGCGIAWLLAQNWNIIPGAAKIIILVALTGGAYGAATYLNVSGFPKSSKALVVLGSLLFTLSIFLVAQVFNIDINLQTSANMFLLAAAGVIAASYIYNSSSSLVIGFIEVIIWLWLQNLAWVTQNFSANSFSLGVLLLTLLAIAVLLYGLGMMHQARNHVFAKTYRRFTAFYILALAYFMSFQLLLPAIWSGSPTTHALTMLGVFALLGIIAYVFGIRARGSSYDTKEKIGFFVVVGIIAIALALTVAAKDTAGSCSAKSCYEYRSENLCGQAPSELNCEWLSDNNWASCTEKSCFNIKEQSSCESSELDCAWSASGNYCVNSDPLAFENVRNSNLWETCQQYNNNYNACSEQELCNWNPGSGGYWNMKSQDMPPVLWFVWIMTNLAFIATVLVVLMHGTILKDNALVNIGIVAFGIFIITRYIGFMMDLWGYTTMAVIFIIGGAVLIFAGIGLEKLRRTLISAPTPQKSSKTNTQRKRK